jgi:hypothetical protein
MFRQSVDVPSTVLFFRQRCFSSVIAFLPSSRFFRYHVSSVSPVHVLTVDFYSGFFHHR